MTIVVIGDNTGNDAAGTEDTELTEGAPTTNSQADALYEISTFGSGDRRFALIRFDLSGLSGPVTVNSVTLRFNGEGGSATPKTMQLKRVIRNWVESQATWNVFSTGNSWSTGGGLHESNDRSSTVSASEPTTNSTGAGFEYEFTHANLASDVEGFINGDFTNNGWHIGLDNETGGGGQSWVLTSSKGSDGSRPELEIDYTEGGGGGSILPLVAKDMDGMADMQDMRG